MLSRRAVVRWSRPASRATINGVEANLRTMMDSELQEHIRKSALDKQLICHVQSLLPSDDAELDLWLADSLPRQAYNEFVSVICAALMEGRHVDPRHLVQGAIILSAGGILPEVVMRMQQGDVPEYL